MGLTVAAHAFAWVFIPLIVKPGLTDDSSSSLRPISC
jgi:hypothetical protein